MIHSSNDDKRHLSLPMIIGAIALTLVICALLCWPICRRWAIRSGYLHLDLGYSIICVVPNGYRGTFDIIEDPINGVPPADLGGGRIEYVIPRDGCLITTDVTPFRTLHREAGRFADGRPLPALGFNDVGDDEVALRPLGGVDDRGIRQLVGTLDEYHDYYKSHRVWSRIEPATDDDLVRVTAYDQLAENVGRTIIIEGTAYTGKGRSDLNVSLIGGKLGLRLVGSDGGWLWPAAAEGKTVVVQGRLNLEEPQVGPVGDGDPLTWVPQTDLKPGERRPTSYFVDDVRCSLKSTGQEVTPVRKPHANGPDPFSD